MKKKVKIGIDINEILRARWLQFDRYYVEEFGEEGTPPAEEAYVYDFFKKYRWSGKTEETKYLNEDLPDDINPIDYQVDEKTGEAPVDYLAFKSKKNELTAKEVYNRFMYEDYLFEIHGSAPIMYKNMEVEVEKFIKKYEEYADFIVVSQENWFSIPPTLFFLSKIMARFKEYRFVEDKQEMWDGVDILITTDPEIINLGTPEGGEIIKLHRPYNKDCQDGSITKELFQLNDLNKNIEFEKIIGYPQDKDEDAPEDVEQKQKENE